RSACEKAELKGLRFHDLRHTCLTNWYNAGHGHLLIMQASGHKTLSCFMRYLSFKNGALQKLVDDHSQQMDTKPDADLSKAM
ncbi:MAG: tyrosine-type recombinase/integrase, partial [Fibrobacteres bacterium]|nr:tyrosine-type recombinase/integrase [Fibrobacterota bacterium]